MNYWIVARRFSDLQEELTRLLRPLSDVRVIIDRRVRRRLAQLRAFPEAPATWALPENETGDGRKRQGALISRDGSQHETSGTEDHMEEPPVRGELVGRVLTDYLTRPANHLFEGNDRV